MKGKGITNQINNLPINADIYMQNIVTKLFDITYKTGCPILAIAPM